MSSHLNPIEFPYNFPQVGQLVQVQAEGLEGEFIEGTVTCRGGNFTHPMDYPIGRDFWFAISYIDKHDGETKFFRISQDGRGWLADISPLGGTISCDVVFLA